MKKIIILLAILFTCPVAFAQDDSANDTVIAKRYIRDTVMVPLRSGHSPAYRVINAGIASGTRVDVLEEDKDSGYSRVRLASGQEGWLPSQYLQNQATAAIELKKAQALISQLTANKDSNGAQLLKVDQENQNLKQTLERTQQQLSSTQAELAHIRDISDNAINLSKDNQRLLKSNEDIKNHRDMLQAENNRLKEALKRDDFINGTIAVILGMIATLAIQYFYRSRRRSEWA